MNRRQRLGLAVVLLALFGICWIIVSRRAIPSYQGRNVYEWMMFTQSSSLDANPGLAAIGTNAIPYLIRAIQYESTPYDRLAVVRSPWVQKLIRFGRFGVRWTHSTAQVRRAALVSLLAFKFEARPALPQLLDELVRPSSPDRQQVVFCLLEIGPSDEMVPYLVQAWNLASNEVWVVRHTILHALGRCGSATLDKGLPVALSALQDGQPELRSAAAGTLEMWGRPSPQAVPALVSMLSATNGNIATAAVRALPVVTNRADQALPALRSLLSGTNEHARAAAAFALWKFGGDADQTRTILESLLTTPRGKGSAAMYLAKMGPLAQPSVDALLKASHENIGAWVDMFDRAMCAEAVLKIQGESEEAIRELENAIRFQQNTWVRATVAKRVGSLGAVARPLIPALRQALDDADFGVRHEAAKSLNKLETITELSKTP